MNNFKNIFKIYSLHSCLSVSVRNTMKRLILIDKGRFPLQGVADALENIREVFLEAGNTHVFITVPTKHWDQWCSFQETVTHTFRSYVNTALLLGKVVKNVRFPFWIVGKNISNMLQAMCYSRTLFDYALEHLFTVTCQPMIRSRVGISHFH